MKKLFLLLTLPIILAGCVKTTGPNITEQAKVSVSSLVAVEQNFKDLGTIAMDKGDVNINYTLTNKGQEPVVIKTMYTSCMCTSAKISIGDDTSQKVGMQGHKGNYNIYMLVEPGQEAEVVATFDPNAHGPQGTGLARRTVFVETNSSKTPTIKLNFEVNVVRTSAEVPDKVTYTDINPKQLSQLLEQEDFVLIDVHIPEQKHIEGTDLFIPFDEINNNTDKLPQDKNSKIVLYCRSGSMSARAADDLVKMGYTDVYNLAGGKNAYDEFLGS